MAFHVAARTILKDDGLAGLYRGFVPNALKNLPNKGEQRRAGGFVGCGSRRLPGSALCALDC